MLRCEIGVEGLETQWGILPLGSLAEWVTAVLALVAGIVAIVALVLSRKANSHARDAAAAAVASSELTDKAYRDDVRVRDEAQARLVYSTLKTEVSVILEGGDVPKPFPQSTPFVHLDGMVSTQQPGLNSAAIVTQSAQVVRVSMHNKSSEIISSIRVLLYDRRSKMELNPPHGHIVLLPEETLDVDFLVPYDQNRFEPEVIFRDAAGKYWSRRGFDPIAALPDERRNRHGLPIAPN